MKDFKKYFFESLIQLTILANVFRQNNTPITNLENPFYNQENLTFWSQQQFQHQSISNELELILNYNSSIHFDQENLPHTENIKVKEARAYLAELRTIDRLNRRLTNRPELPSTSHQAQDIVLQPATAFYPSNSHKRIIDLSETRILLNSLELNNNVNNTFRKEFEMDIELQTLIEQDIDLGIKNSIFFKSTDPGKNELQLNNNNNNDLNKVKHLFQNQFTENQKHQDILSVTKFMEDHTQSDRYKVCVEEDTGEILHLQISNNSQQYSQNLSDLNTTSHNLIKNQLNEARVQNNTKDQRKINDKPVFLSQTSVSNELNKLSETSNLASSSHSFDMNLTGNIGELSNLTFDTFPALNEDMLNEYLEENLLTDSQKSSFDIQQDLETANFLNNQTQIIPDVFEFDENFLKTFESNLTKMNSGNDLNNNSIMTQNSNNIYFNQTILTNNSTENNQLVNLNSASYQKQLNQQESSLSSNQSAESLNFLGDQFDLSDIFKTLDTSQGNNSMNNFTSFDNATINKNQTASNFFTEMPPIQTESKNKINMTKNIKLKQESVDVPENYQSQQTSNNRLNRPSYIYSDITSDETQATIRGLNHNHTYMDGVKGEEDSEVYHPYSYKNKLKKMLKNLKNNDVNNTRQQESRDQILLQENNINLSIHHIVESSADEFNEIIKSMRLSSEQLTIVKDIRRRGKNKVAAQICRKRKIDSIDSLKEDVEQLSGMKELLDQEQGNLEREVSELTMKFDNLYHDLMGEEYDSNDPIIIYMNNLKNQMNLNTRLKHMSSRSMNSEESENSLYYDLSSQNSDLIESDYEEDSNNSKKNKLNQNTSSISRNKRFKN